MSLSPQLLLAIMLITPFISSLLTFSVKNQLFVFKYIHSTLLFISGVLAVVLGANALLTSAVETFTYSPGLPWLFWHLKLDPLAGFFLVLIGLVVTAISLFAPGYSREFAHGRHPLSILSLFTGLFISAMFLVVLSNDGFVFMIGWELMSLACYFLVAYQHQHAANRRAAFLYLLMAHVGALSILLSFGVLAKFGGGFTFDAMRTAPLDLTWASIAFGLGLFGFGMKAGIVPIHIWLPEAHPVAPSHISALMSGVMLKVAIYGFIRLSFDLIGDIHWGWGVTLLILGSITALFGVLYALVQHDLKRLLAYHSIENIGIIFIGLGLAMIFFGTQHPLLGTLGLVAALYHTLNHALFKSLLFLGAGAILQRSHERDLERMGGLLHRMPWTGLFFLIGCISISALPPFNGFVSEWLTFQTALQVASLESGVLRAMIPIAAASLALTGALAAACFVKVYGIAFLGLPRSRHVRRTREASFGMVLAQAFLAILCLLFGIFPAATVDAMANITQSLTGEVLNTATSHGWLWLTPVSKETASYSAPLVLVGIVLALLAWAVVNYILRPAGVAKSVVRDPWDCGFGGLNTRMQYTATAFAMPIRRVFSPVWRMQEGVEREPMERLPLEPGKVSYQLQTEDITLKWFYQPIVQLIRHSSRQLSRIQTGHLHHYLTYSFVTLIVLLWVIT